MFVMDYVCDLVVGDATSSSAFRNWLRHLPPVILLCHKQVSKCCYEYVRNLVMHVHDDACVILLLVDLWLLLAQCMVQLLHMGHWLLFWMYEVMYYNILLLVCYDRSYWNMIERSTV